MPCRFQDDLYTGFIESETQYIRLAAGIDDSQLIKRFRYQRFRWRVAAKTLEEIENDVHFEGGEFFTRFLKRRHERKKNNIVFQLDKGLMDGIDGLHYAFDGFSLTIRVIARLLRLVID